jgi:hypothetical protein
MRTRAEARSEYRRFPGAEAPLFHGRVSGSGRGTWSATVARAVEMNKLTPAVTFMADVHPMFGRR